MMEEEDSFIFILNNIEHPVEFDIALLPSFPKKIQHELIFKGHKYYIQSEVNYNVFKSFIDYIIKKELPKIEIDNIQEYSQLSEEFEIMKEIIKEKEEEFGEDLKFYEGLHLSDREEQIYYENKISEKLDYYLHKYQTNIMNEPIEILQHIFFNSNRQLNEHNYAYELIKIQYERTKDSNIFVLLPSLDGFKLSQENLEESIIKQNERYGFLPRIEMKYINDMKDKIETQENIIKEQKSKIEHIEQTIINIQNSIQIEIEKILTQHSQEISELKTILHNIENSNEEIKTKQNREEKINQTNNEQIRQEIKEMKENISNQTNEFNLYKTKQDENNETNQQTIENKINEIKTKSNKNEEEIKTIKTEQKQVNKSIRKQIKQNIDNLKETISKQNSKNQSNQQTIENKIEKIQTQHSQEISELKTILHNIENSNEEIKTKQNQEEEINQTNNEQIKEMKENISKQTNEFNLYKTKQEENNKSNQQTIKSEIEKSKSFLLTKISENSSKFLISFKPSLTEPGILYNLKTESKSIFDPPFIASQSSNDIYNLIDPNTKDRFSTNSDAHFFIKFELENPIPINGIKIFSAIDYFPKSFDIEIDDEIIQSIKEANELNGKNQEMKINFPSKTGKTIRFIQTGPNWNKNNDFINIKRIELLSPESKYSDGIFTTLISKSKTQDPHNCGVHISSIRFDLNSFYLNDTKLNIWTYPDENSWFQIELTRGFAIITGFRLKRDNSIKMKSYKIVVSNDINKPIDSWDEMIKINEKSKGEHKIMDIYKFSQPSAPIKFIRIIQTGPTWSDNKNLLFYHFELFGTYL